MSEDEKNTVEEKKIADEKVRQCLKIIRLETTMPDDILPNGLTASETAFNYMIQSRQKRSFYKREGQKKRKHAG